MQPAMLRNCLLALACFGASLCAQTGTNPPAPPIPDPNTGEMPPDEIRAMEEGMGVPSMDVTSTPPHVVAARHAGLHASPHFDVVTMQAPQRLAPGERGQLHIVVNLVGNAVVLPRSTKKLAYKPSQGKISLGSFVLGPAPRAELKSRFQGKPAWDNTMIFKVPVSVDAKTPHGKVPFEGDLELEVFDGKSGNRLTVGRASVRGQVVVGRPFPKPVPIRTVKAGDPEVKTKDSSKAPPPVGDVERQMKGSETAQRNRADGAGSGDNPKAGDLKAGPAGDKGGQAGQQSSPSDASDGQEVSEEGDALPYWLPGGGLILVLGLLLLRKK